MSEHDEAGVQAPNQAEPPEEPSLQVVARYGLMGHLGLFRCDFESPPAPGTLVVVRTARGAELAQVLISVGAQEHPWCIGPDSLEQYLNASGPEYPIGREGRILRPASPQDVNDQQHLDRSAREEGAFCREQIRQLALGMKLICTEHLLGGERIVFYFTADQRVDFRELVRRLASQYHTRIEMRQVGARDEARLVADYERCGRRCCCQEYLKLLKPVSMKMAKSQKATLDPTKISGRCGRLMCCLRFEDATYEELQAALPRKNAWVRTADGVVGKVADVQIITQLVRLTLPDQAQMVVANEDIVERDLPEPPPGRPTQPQRPERPAAEPPQSAPAAWQPSRPQETSAPVEEVPDEQVQEDQPQPAQTGDHEDRPAGGEPSGQQRKKNRPRRRRRKSRHPQALSAPPQPRGNPGDAAGQSNRPRRRRPRRRGKNGPTGGQPGRPGA